MSALDDRAWAAEDDSLFSPLVSTAIVVGGALVFALLWLTSEGRRTVLLTPVDPQMRAVLVAIGVFAGVWVAAVVREFWQLGVRLDGPIPEGLALVFRLAVMVAAGGWCGFEIAERATEWRAFHGLQALAARSVFSVAGLAHHRRGADRLNLVGASGALSVSCWAQDCHGLRTGDRLLVTVETGRGGVRRAVFPAVVSERAERG